MEHADRSMAVLGGYARVMEPPVSDPVPAARMLR